MTLTNRDSRGTEIPFQSTYMANQEAACHISPPHERGDLKIPPSTFNRSGKIKNEKLQFIDIFNPTTVTPNLTPVKRKLSGSL